MLAERVNSEQRCRALLQPYRANELKFFAGEMDAIITGRMHLAIAALGCGVPVGCVTYQGKFEGLFDHFLLKPPVLAPDNVTVDSLHELITTVIDQNQYLADKIADRLPVVTALSRRNIVADL